VRLYRGICHLLLLFSIASCRLLQAQETPVPYGANAAAGHYLETDGVRLYYEVYGSGGTPLVLLHGGLYGYIDEFGELIQAMSQHRRVIAIATRGHGRSEIGSQPFSYPLLAKDALAVIRHETSGKIDVVGFSDGAITSYLLAGEHPELIRRLVAIGGPRGAQDWTEAAVEEFRKSQPGDVEKNNPKFVADRKKLMPAPERWEQFVTRVMKMEGGAVKVTDQQIRSIQAPTLIVAGDRDPYNRTEKIVEIYRELPQGELVLIPGCGHVVLECKARLTIEAAAGFLDHTGP
jgi:pimeloyl-ACP methyl ester carboxylesterase